jgi:hypothetical protein
MFQVFLFDGHFLCVRTSGASCIGGGMECMLAVLGTEARVPHMPGKFSTTGGMPPALLFLFLRWDLTDLALLGLES